MEVLTNALDALAGRLMWASVYAAALFAVIALVFAYRRPSARWECWVWRLACVKLLLMVMIPIAIELPILPNSSSDLIDQAKVRPTNGDAALQLARGLSPAENVMTGEAADPERRFDDEAHASLHTHGDRIAARESKQRSESTSLQPSFVSTLKWLVFVAWVFGVLFQLGRIALHWFQAQSLLAGVNLLQNSLLIHFAHQRAKRLGLRRPPRLFVTTKGNGPKLIGVRNPCIVFSDRFIRECTPQETQLVIEHEIAHIVRSDILWNWIVALAQILFFFHPLVWWAARRIQVTQEMACDEMVLSSHHARLGVYANLLLKLTLIQQPRERRRLAEVSASGRTGTLEERLLAMKGYSMTQRNLRSMGWYLAVGLAMLMLPWKLVAYPTQDKVDSNRASQSPSDKVTTKQQPGDNVASTVVRSLGTGSKDPSSTTQDEQKQGQSKSRPRTSQGTVSQSSSSGSSQSTRQSSVSSSSGRTTTSSSSTGGSTGHGSTVSRDSTSSSDVRLSVSYTANGRTLSVKQTDESIVVEIQQEVEGKTKTETYRFASVEEFKKALPKEFSQFREMTSAASKPGRTTVATGGGSRTKENPAQQMMLDNLLKLREENRENASMCRLIDQMIADLQGKTENRDEEGHK